MTVLVLDAKAALLVGALLGLDVGLLVALLVAMRQGGAEVQELLAENVEKFIADGPRLRYDYNVWVEAKDSEKGKVLLGGLGGCGVGSMWVPMQKHHRGYPGFDGAPEVSAPPDFEFEKLSV